MQKLYKPFSIVLGVLAGQLAKRIFTAVWAKIDAEEAPTPTDRRVDPIKFVTATALQGLILQLTKAFVARGGAKGVQHLTGFWPGDEAPEPKKAKRK